MPVVRGRVSATSGGTIMATHRQRARRGLVVGAIVAATVVAVCGSDSKSSDSTAAPATTAAATSAASATTTKPAATSGSTASTAATGTSAPTTAGAGSTAAGGGQFGLVDGTYKGAGGFTLDPKACPSDWNINQGITDSEIDMFASYPTSGPLAGFALIYDGSGAYYDYVAQNGGIDGRKIVLDGKDDQYAPAATKTNSDEALAANKYAVFDSMLGTPNNLGDLGRHQPECMPQLLNATGAPQWGDVENHPWTTGAPALELLLRGRSVGGVVEAEVPERRQGRRRSRSTTTSGRAYLKGFKHFIEGSNIQLIADFAHDPTAPNVDNQYTSAAASGADVLLIQTTGTFCTQALADVEKGSWHPTVILSATCGFKNQVFQPLIDQGLTGKDTYTIVYYKDILGPGPRQRPVHLDLLRRDDEGGPRPEEVDLLHRVDLRVVHDPGAEESRTSTRAGSTAATSCWRRVTAISCGHWRSKGSPRR